MEQSSSAYSSLANSSTDINVMINNANSNSNSNSRKCSEQVRNITNDYNALLVKATKELRVLTAEKAKLERQCEQLMTVNENLVEDVKQILKKEDKIKKENEDICKANADLFKEAQRLSDEEVKWAEERNCMESRINALEEAVKANESESEALRIRLTEAERDRHELIRRKESASGENMQLMLDFEEQVKLFQSQMSEMKSQLKVEQRKNSELRVENGRLKENGGVKHEGMEKLQEMNRNLTDWREQLIAKNKVLNEENQKLKNKCQNLEDLLNEEETDLNDVIEVIKRVQATSPELLADKIGPISKLRDLKLK